MRVFFWASVFTYVVLYFWAAYLYEGFDMGLAILIAVVFFGVIGFWLKRKRSMPTPAQEPVVRSDEDTKPLNIWQSPLPYMVIAVTAFLITFAIAL